MADRRSRQRLYKAMPMPTPATGPRSATAGFEENMPIDQARIDPMRNHPTTPIQRTPMAIFRESSLAADEWDGFEAAGSTGTDCPPVHAGPAALTVGREDVGLVAHRVQLSFAWRLDFGVKP